MRPLLSTRVSYHSRGRLSIARNCDNQATHKGQQERPDCSGWQIGGEVVGVGAVGWVVGGAVFEGDDVVRAETNLRSGRGGGGSERLAVEVELPAGLFELLREVEAGEAVVPDGDEVVEGQPGIVFAGSLDVNDAVGGVRMEPVEATAAGGNADALGNGDGVAFDIDGKMHMDVIGDTHVRVTADAVDGRVGGSERGLEAQKKVTQ